MISVLESLLDDGDHDWLTWCCSRVSEPIHFCCLPTYVTLCFWCKDSETIVYKLTATFSCTAWATASLVGGGSALGSSDNPSWRACLLTPMKLPFLPSGVRSECTQVIDALLTKSASCALGLPS